MLFFELSGPRFLSALISERLPIEPMDNVCFESDAVVAEGVIRFDWDMFGFRASVLFQNLKQCFAVWASAIVRRDEQNWALSNRGS